MFFVALHKEIGIGVLLLFFSATLERLVYVTKMRCPDLAQDFSAIGQECHGACARRMLTILITLRSGKQIRDCRCAVMNREIILKRRKSITEYYIIDKKKNVFIVF